MHACMYMYILYVFFHIYRYFSRHRFRYMQIRTCSDNTHKYVHTYEICTMCKCTYLLVFLSEYDIIRDPLLEIRTNTYNMVHWCGAHRRSSPQLLAQARSIGSSLVLATISIILNLLLSFLPNSPPIVSFSRDAARFLCEAPSENFQSHNIVTIPIIS